ncbi:alpha/beta-hydrolase family protein [Rhodococcus sp. NPDC060084]|uniref:alpha/beta-hydrolase family protein n=1 Tax=Rhodococcus sp. NPDC060084 TaxID=3347053 RepID=UPI00366413FB
MSILARDHTAGSPPLHPGTAGRVRSVLASSGPTIGTSVTIAVALWFSLAPSLLPRTSSTQGLVSGLVVVLALAVRAGIARMRAPRPARVSGETEVRYLAASVAAASVVIAGTGAHHWQNALREAMGQAQIGPRYWLDVFVTASIAAALLVFSARVVRTILRNRRGRRIAVTIGTACLATWFAAGSALLSPAPGAPDPTSLSPLPSAAGLAGSKDSLVGWDTLGREGQRFVSLASAGSAVRTYVGLESAPDVPERAALAVRELERAGGFDRAHLVLAVPTGSGWVDAHAVEGFEARWGTDVAIVAQQYSDAPSWMTFLTDRDAAAESARTLTSAVRAHVDGMPASHRPEVHVYGQSLGASGAAAAFPDAEPGSCDTVLSGPPAGMSPPGGTVLANSSDPVVWWQPSLLWSPPDLSHARVDAPVPPWLPVITFAQTTVDLLTSLDAAPGHGHRYGQDQAQCTP